MSKQNKNYLFLFSREYPHLAFAECQALHPKAKEWSATESYATAEIENLHCKHLACSKKVFHLFKQGSLEEIKKFVETWPLEKFEESVSFNKICLEEACSEESFTSEEARKLLSTFTQKPNINLTNPDRKFVLLCEKNTYFIAEDVWENKEKFSKRRNHLLPAPHPTSLQPKLARALINLANPAEGAHILDPFCGSGGILIESSLMNFRTSGIDLDSDMIIRAKKNLASLNLKAELHEGDATKYLFDADCIITDLPYGKNSKANNLEELYESFLKKAEEYTKRMIVAYPHIVALKSIVEKTRWKINKEFSLPLHKSLTKNILVLEL